jgi:tetratricopeptide (TPR) repeat protein
VGVVRDLWLFLRANGVDARLDLPAAGNRQDWALWMADQIREADHVLVIASRAYRHRAEGRGGSGTGRGVQWEARLIRDLFYADQRSLDRFLPVVLPGQSVAGVPDFLAPATSTVYTVSDLTTAGAEELLRLLTGQPAITAPPMGPAPRFPKRPNAPEKPPGRPAISNLPPRNPHFTGRKESISHYFHNASTARIVALTGMGGVGKSQLAIELAHESRNRQECDILWWIRADDALAATEDLIALASALGIPTAEDHEQSILAVQDELRGRDRWLLVLDNAPSVHSALRWLPRTDRGRVLVTSRSDDWVEVADRVRMSGFTTSESLEYLRRRTGHEQEHARELAETLDNLPLAIAQAASYLHQHGGLSIERYLRMYSEREGAGVLLAEGLPGYPETVATTWLVHFEQLSNWHPAALELLRLCGFLYPDSINLDLILSESGPLAGRLTKRLAESASRLVSREQVIGDLIRTGLVSRIDDSRVRVHRLVCEITRHQLSSYSTEVARDWASCSVNLISTVAKAPDAEHETWPSAGDVLPHVLRCADWIAEYDLRTPLGAELLRRSGRYLVRFGRFDDAERVLGLTMGLVERENDIEPREIARTLKAVASLHTARAEFAEAEVLCRRAIQVRGGDHVEDVDTAETLNDLGWILRKQGRYQPAEPLFRRALDIRRRVLGAENPTVARSINDMGCLLEEMGRYADARALYEAALDMRKGMFGNGHPDTATSFWDLGWVYRRLGDYGTAERYFRSALEIRRDIYGDKNLETAASCRDLAWIYLRTDRAQAARQLLDESLVACEELVGADHPDTAATIHDLGLHAAGAGDLETAERLYTRALGVRERRLGDRHPDTASSISELAHVRELQGNLSDAELLYQRAAAIHEHLADVTHPDVPVILSNLARVCVKSGKPREAAALMRNAMSAIRTLGLGTDHPDVVRVCAQYAEFGFQPGR